VLRLVALVGSDPSWEDNRRVTLAVSWLGGANRAAKLDPLAYWACLAIGAGRWKRASTRLLPGPRGVGIAIMKYAVKFMHPLTGHKIDVFVDLTREQEADVRGQRHASPDHPLAKRYAIENAVKLAPRGYILVQGETRSVDSRQ
jgi:hypothetical protein